MNQKTVKMIRKIIGKNMNDLVTKLYEEKYRIRLKFAFRLILNKKPFKFYWKEK